MASALDKLTQQIDEMQLKLVEYQETVDLKKRKATRLKTSLDTKKDQIKLMDKKALALVKESKGKEAEIKDLSKKLRKVILSTTSQASSGRRGDAASSSACVDPATGAPRPKTLDAEHLDTLFLDTCTKLARRCEFERPTVFLSSPPCTHSNTYPLLICCQSC
jgi:hypothetical protein